MIYITKYYWNGHILEEEIRPRSMVV